MQIKHIKWGQQTYLQLTRPWDACRMWDGTCLNQWVFMPSLARTAYDAKGLRGIEPKSSMFCVLSQNDQQYLENKCKLPEANIIRNSKMALSFFFSSPSNAWVIDLNHDFACFNQNSRTVGRTKILIPFLSLSDNLLQNNHNSFQKRIDNLEIVDSAQNMLNFDLGCSCPLNVTGNSQSYI